MNNLIPIGILFIFLGTLVTIYYTRRNLKTMKYIDTITSERIKWIDKLRNDLSLLTSWITIYISNNKCLNELYEESKELNDDDLRTNPYGDEPWSTISASINENYRNQEEIKNELEKVSRQQIIEKIHLIKLKFNYSDDINAIEILDRLITYFTPPKFDVKKYDLINEDIIEILSISQTILKAEWDKVKIETKKGI